MTSLAFPFWNEAYSFWLLPGVAHALVPQIRACYFVKYYCIIIIHFICLRLNAVTHIIMCLFVCFTFWWARPCNILFTVTINHYLEIQKGLLAFFHPFLLLFFILTVICNNGGISFMRLIHFLVCMTNFLESLLKILFWIVFIQEEVDSFFESAKLSLFLLSFWE